ncbi:unnamed protein product [Ectocarpus sp. CCAP 1310/34]|nr:unnamed protein product [Ectocarpus sp. CCAP 1310/34]
MVEFKDTRKPSCACLLHRYTEERRDAEGRRVWAGGEGSKTDQPRGGFPRALSSFWLVPECVLFCLFFLILLYVAFSSKGR